MSTENSLFTESPLNICDSCVHISSHECCDMCKYSNEIPYLNSMNSSYYYMESDVYYSNELNEVMNNINEALEYEYYPSLINDCSGGTYLCTNFHDDNEAIFKPKDEEPYCINNPKHYLIHSASLSTCSENKIYMKEGILPGESYIREYFAYICDHNHWSCVPPTIIAKMSSPTFCINKENQEYNINNKLIQTDKKSTNSLITKEGSLQLFVENQGSAEDFGVCKFNYKDVHHIGILDIRLYNLDRHQNNLLSQTQNNKKSNKSRRSYSFNFYDTPVNTMNTTYNKDTSLLFSASDSITKGVIHLIPIDHGYCIPSILHVTIPEWSWYKWEQSYLPFSKNDKEYIMSLNIDNDIDYIHHRTDFIFTNEYILTLKVQELWIKMCIQHNFNLHQIASIYIDLYDSNSQSISIFMHLINEVYNQIHTIEDIHLFLNTILPYFEIEISRIEK